MKMAEPSPSHIRKEIESILCDADLSTLSSKKVRKLLEGSFKLDLSSRKKEIDKVLMEELAKKEKKDGDESGDEEDESNSKQEEEKHKQPEGDGSQSDSSFETPDDMSPPELKKPKVSHKPSEIVGDEELARQLQEEDSGGRRTRHCRQRHAHKKSKTKTKTKSERSKKGVKTGYNADMMLSPDLANIMGSEMMSRSEVVKRMWQIVKERQLADPKNKQFHICDEQLLKVFGTKRVRTFSMMKYLKRHIKDPDLLSNS